MGTMCIGFGVNAFLYPEFALSFFEFDYPAAAAEQALVDNLMVVYGARDVFMGLAVYIASWYGNSKAVGAMLVSVGAVAFVDGFVCWRNGHGEWGHWGYAPVAAALGVLLLGGV